MIVDLRKQISVAKPFGNTQHRLQSPYSCVIFLLQSQPVVSKITTLVNYFFTFFEDDRKKKGTALFRMQESQKLKKRIVNVNLKNE